MNIAQAGRRDGALEESFPAQAKSLRSEVFRTGVCRGLRESGEAPLFPAENERRALQLFSVRKHSAAPRPDLLKAFLELCLCLACRSSVLEP